MCLEEMKHMKVHELTCALHLAIMGRFGPSILAVSPYYFLSTAVTRQLIDMET